MVYKIWLIICLVLFLLGFYGLAFWGFILLCIVWGNSPESSRSKSSSDANSKPPTEDVLILGCDPGCGYFGHKLERRPNGEYEFIRKNGKLAAHCKYQCRDVCQGDPCQFAKDHPDKLGKSVFDY